MSRFGNILFLVVLVFWSVLIGFSDYLIANTTIRQYLAGGFSFAKGRIVYSQVTQRRILRGGITIKYVYAVNGRNYGGSRYRYDDHNLAMSWENVVGRLPDHAPVRVYYDPKDPADSLLSPGVSGGDLLLLMLSVPINVVLLMLWPLAVSRAKDRWGQRGAGGAKVMKRRGKVCVRLADTSALAAGLCAGGAAAFLCVLPLVISQGFDPPVKLMETVWVGVIGIGVLAAVWMGLLNFSGRYDLCLDEVARTVSLPATRPRAELTTIPQGAVTAILVQRRVIESFSGSYRSFLPSLRWTEGGGANRTLPLVRWGWTEARATAFAQWLSVRMGIPFTGAEEEASET
jgi:hypothetical protein